MVTVWEAAAWSSFRTMLTPRSAGLIASVSSTSERCRKYSMASRTVASVKLIRGTMISSSLRLMDCVPRETRTGCSITAAGPRSARRTGVSQALSTCVIMEARMSLYASSRTWDFATLTCSIPRRAATL